jgi:endonuclease/exonuclease/phosphatase (EEP) superfamily protein YafD
LQQELETQGNIPEEGKPAKPRHRQWSGVVLALLFGVGGLAVGRLGQLYPHFDVFSQFGLQFLAICVAFIFAVFIPRFKTLVGVVFTVGLLALYSAWPHIISSDLQTRNFTLAAGEQALRVAHFNTFKNNLDYDAIAQEVLRLDADVVSLIEMSDKKKQAVLPKLLANYPYQFDCTGFAHCSQAIVSKIPIKEAGGQGLWEGPPYVAAKLGGPFDGVTFFSVHTTRFPHSRAQLKQVRALTKLLENYPGQKIVAGDFNATLFSRVLSTLENGAALQRITDLPTWPAQWQMPQLAIDHIFISQGFRVVGNQQIGANVGSDHYPILTTVALKPTN